MDKENICLKAGHMMIYSMQLQYCNSKNTHPQLNLDLLFFYAYT